MDFNGKLALITGGSSGIGLAVAKKLAASGANTWILGRNPERLAQALEAVRAAQRSPDQRSGCLAADVSIPEQMANAVQELEATAGVADVLVTSAGTAHPGYVEELDLAIFREMIDIDYMGTVYAVKAVLPGMLRRGSGAIVTISSVAGFLGTFGYTAYGAAKYAVRGFSDTLRAELKPRGIQVSIVFPPDTDTPQLAYENQFKPFETRELAGNIKAMSADAVAEAILKGVARGKYTIIPGFESKFYYRLTGIVGDLTYPIMDWMIGDALKKKAKMGMGDK